MFRSEGVSFLAGVFLIIFTIFVDGIREQYIMNKYIRTILAVVLTVTSYITAYCETDKSEIRRVLDDVNEYLNEKPDSAFAVLNALEITESEDGETQALYAILHAKAEFIVTDTIKSDALLQNAISYYNGVKSLRSSLAYYYLGCYYFEKDYDKASYAFQRSIDYIPDGNNNQKGRAYHALGSCLFAKGSMDEGVKAYKTALTLLDEKESESNWKLCQDIKTYLNNVASVKRQNVIFALFVSITILLLSGLGVFVYIRVKRRHPTKDDETESSDNPLEQKLKDGRQSFEETASYKILLEIRSLNESELQLRTDINTKEIEDAVLASFSEAYHILAEMESKLNHQDLLLCLYGYLKVPNNVIALCMKSVPGTIRQRKLRLQGKLPEDVRIMLFS